jgi:hypothetical protein
MTHALLHLSARPQVQGGVSGQKTIRKLETSSGNETFVPRDAFQPQNHKTTKPQDHKTTKP